MPKPLIKITDLYINPAMSGAASPIAAMGSTTLFVEGFPVVQMTDALSPVTDMAAPNPNTVFHNGVPLIGQTDLTSFPGNFLIGTITVLID